MLFMPEVPPPDNPNIPDLRTISGKQLTNPSLAFRNVLNDTVIRQEWIREERIEQGAVPLDYVGRFSTADDPKTVAADMRHVLQLESADRAECHDFDAFLRHLVNRAESVGALVMRSAIVGHDTHRKLDVKEFRGFAISDAFAPVVFINDVDAKAAQVFTLAHELAHIWIGADGVSDRRPNQKEDSLNAIELFCDKVAAELLVPETEFKQPRRLDRLVFFAHVPTAICAQSLPGFHLNRAQSVSTYGGNDDVRIWGSARRLSGDLAAER
jgi:hypothetical protein